MTRHLRVDVAGDGRRRSIDLLRSDDGEWRCGAEAGGAFSTGGELAAPGPSPRSPATLGREGLDRDAAFAALTNLGCRSGVYALDREPGAQTPTMAWVSVPDLQVHADEQHYVHLAPERVRFSQPSGFAAELLLDADGLVRRYPGIAERFRRSSPSWCRHCCVSDAP